MTQKILGCPEGFPLWQAGGATNFKRSKKCNYSAFACSLGGKFSLSTDSNSSSSVVSGKNEELSGKRMTFSVRFNGKITFEVA
jgi:hypothetical protein